MLKCTKLLSAQSLSEWFNQGNAFSMAEIKTNLEKFTSSVVRSLLTAILILGFGNGGWPGAEIWEAKTIATPCFWA